MHTNWTPEGKSLNNQGRIQDLPCLANSKLGAFKISNVHCIMGMDAGSDPGLGLKPPPPPLQVNEMRNIHFGQNTNSHYLSEA